MCCLIWSCCFVIGQVENHTIRSSKTWRGSIVGLSVLCRFYFLGIFWLQTEPPIPNDDHFDPKIVNLHLKIVFMWAVESVSFLLRYLSKYYFKKTTVLFDVNLDLCIHGLNYRKLAQNWKEHKCSFIIKKNLVSCKISSWCTSSGCEKTFRITFILSELPLSRNVK